MAGVLIVARDVGLAAPLAMVSTELVKLGMGVTALLREFPTKSISLVDDAAGGADFVLAGMSSSVDLADHELTALEFAAMMEDIPFGVFSDTFDAWKGREWFEEYRQEATALFVLNEEEAVAARAKYPQAQVFGFGNPRWEEFFTQRLTRAEVRARLGAAGRDIVIDVPGGKDLAVNLAHFEGVVAAAEKLNDQNHHFVVAISLHPGDKNERAEYAKRVGNHPCVRITDKLLISGDDMLAGVDMVVQSASTVGVTASCQRIPVINFFTEKALDRLAGNAGSREWSPVAHGTELAVVEDVAELADMMGACLNLERGTLAGNMIDRQAQVYPRPIGEPAAARIAKAIRDLIADKAK